jgi:hypothetical protein
LLRLMLLILAPLQIVELPSEQIALGLHHC